jgi:hypothetical protein
MKKTINIKCLVITILPLLFSQAEAERFSMGNETIRAKISLQHPNRISVKGDKIASVSGLEQAFYYEKNEKTGDGFLRPTEANGRNPISLSITTSSGKTQDLLLEPTDGDPSTLELIGEEQAGGAVPDTGNDNLALPTGDYESGIAEAMKRAISEKDVVEAAENIPDRKYGIFRAKFEKCYFVKGYLCCKFSVTADVDGELSPQENHFSEAGDVALSFSNLKISKGNPAYLYVLRR